LFNEFFIELITTRNTEHISNMQLPRNLIDEFC